MKETVESVSGDTEQDREREGWREDVGWGSGDKGRDQPDQIWKLLQWFQEETPRG